jgi:hypothetical protein
MPVVMRAVELSHDLKFVCGQIAFCIKSKLLHNISVQSVMQFLSTSEEGIVNGFVFIERKVYGWICPLKETPRAIER